MLVEKPPARMVVVSEPSLADKIEFLMRGDSYRPPVREVVRHETHMSEVFLADDRVYKLKKPVRFPYLDFSTLGRREAACRAELKLNRRLAPNVYLDVVPLACSAQGLAIAGDGEVVDWLVVMTRLDESQMLDCVIEGARLHRWQLDRLAATLVNFYRRAHAVFVSRKCTAHNSGKVSPTISEFYLIRDLICRPGLFGIWMQSNAAFCPHEQAC